MIPAGHDLGSVFGFNGAANNAYAFATEVPSASYVSSVLLGNSNLNSALGGPGASDLLLPRADLSRLFPDAAAQFVKKKGGEVIRTAPGVTKVDDFATDLAKLT